MKSQYAGETAGLQAEAERRAKKTALANQAYQAQLTANLAQQKMQQDRMAQERQASLESATQQQPVQSAGGLAQQAPQAREQTDEEGFTELFKNLLSGITPDQAVRKFNSQGKYRNLKTAAFNPETFDVAMQDMSGGVTKAPGEFVRKVTGIGMEGMKEAAALERAGLQKPLTPVQEAQLKKTSLDTGVTKAQVGESLINAESVAENADAAYQKALEDAGKGTSVRGFLGMGQKKGEITAQEKAELGTLERAATIAKRKVENLKGLIEPQAVSLDATATGVHPATEAGPAKQEKTGTAGKDVVQRRLKDGTVVNVRKLPNGQWETVE